jgi:hypothetical protein
MSDWPGIHNEPQVYPVKGNLYEIREPLWYVWTIDGVTQKLIVPASKEKPFRFDGASIPVWATFLTWLIPGLKTIYPMGIHIYDTAFHDFTWLYKGRVPLGTHLVRKITPVSPEWRRVYPGNPETIEHWIDAQHVWTFTETNRLFGRQLKEDGVGPNERNVMKDVVESPIGRFNFNRGKLPADARCYACKGKGHADYAPVPCPVCCGDGVSNEEP